MSQFHCTCLIIYLILIICNSINCHPLKKQSLKGQSQAHRALHNRRLFGGDIIRFPKIMPSGIEAFNAVAEDNWLWDKAVIPYYIDSSLELHKQMIIDVMKQISHYTCIKFRPKTLFDSNFVRIFKGTGCYSTIGKDDDNPEMISLGEGCYYHGTITHELMHTIGFYHLQNRSDRDQYLKIFWGNIDPAYKDEFRKLHPLENKILTDFDYSSIMLYGPRSYSIDGESITMQPSYEGYTMVEVYEKPGLTVLDAQAIRKLYKC